MWQLLLAPFAIDNYFIELSFIENLQMHYNKCYSLHVSKLTSFIHYCKKYFMCAILQFTLYEWIIVFYNILIHYYYWQWLHVLLQWITFVWEMTIKHFSCTITDADYCIYLVCNIVIYKFFNALLQLATFACLKMATFVWTIEIENI